MESSARGPRKAPFRTAGCHCGGPHSAGSFDHFFSHPPRASFGPWQLGSTTPDQRPHTHQTTRHAAHIASIAPSHGQLNPRTQPDPNHVAACGQDAPRPARPELDCSHDCHFRRRCCSPDTMPRAPHRAGALPVDRQQAPPEQRALVQGPADPKYHEASSARARGPRAHGPDAPRVDHGEEL
ncbi:hypothetical protein VTI74DRAFT_3338 [Chaetomium olivicolor]